MGDVVNDRKPSDAAAAAAASPEARARAERDARLAAALRANLRRRKAVRPSGAGDSDAET